MASVIHPAEGEKSPTRENTIACYQRSDYGRISTRTKENFLKDLPAHHAERWSSNSDPCGHSPASHLSQNYSHTFFHNRAFFSAFSVCSGIGDTRMLPQLPVQPELRLKLPS